MLDSEGPLSQSSDVRTDDMLDWLDADLEAADRPFTVAIWHRPPYEGHPRRLGHPPALTALVPRMDAHGVDLVLSGHNHHYERIGPTRAGVPDEKGTTYIISGGGGRGLDPIEFWPNQKAAASIHHFLRGYADGCTLRVEALDTAGTVFDTFEKTRC